MLMTLAPGECFEHMHQSHSTTTVIAGSVDLVIDGTRQSLEVGVPTPIGARVSHLLINVGDQSAVIECGHQQTPPKEVNAS
jgi:uncharacterized cupin superfamily protein